MKDFEREYNRVKVYLEKYGNTVISKYADEIVERLQNEGIDVVVREFEEFKPMSERNIYDFRTHKRLTVKIIERRK